MPPKAKKNAVILIGNIGSSSLDQSSIEDEPFIDKMKFSMKILIEKRIFLQPKDVMQIITMGDNESNNPEEMDFVKLYSDDALIPNWEMVKYVQSLSATENESNWIEALHVALEFKKRKIQNDCFQTIVVVFNNFKESKESIDNFDADAIIADIHENHQDAIILFIGENPINEKSNLSPSEEFIFKFMNQLGAQYDTINDFMKVRRLFQPTKTKPMPWKFELEFGGLDIPCASYVMMSKPKTFGKWLLKGIKSNDDSNAAEKTFKKDIVKERLALDHTRNKISAEDTISGYRFGGKYIPATEDDEAAMKYSGTIKGMIVCGFVPQSEVKLEFWTGDGSRIIVPQSIKGSKYTKAFYSFVQALADAQYVAIVKKVYRANCLPKIGVLFPKLDDDNVWCLVHLEIPFAEDIKTIPKRSIKPVNEIASEQQIKALDDFIDSMTVDDDDVEHLNPCKFPSFQQQYMYSAFSHRALHPDAPLLSPMKYLMEYLMPPEQLKRAAKPHLEKLNQVFPIPVQEKKKKKKDKTGDIQAKQVVVDKNETKDEPIKVDADQVEKSNGNDKSSADDGFYSLSGVEFKDDDFGDM